MLWGQDLRSSQGQNLSPDPRGSHTLASESLGVGGVQGRDYQRVMTMLLTVVVLQCVHVSKLTKQYILDRCNLLYVNYISA